MTQYIPITELKKTKDFSVRPSDWDSLKFAKVSVFSPISINDATEKIVKHKIPDGHFWEHQQTLCFKRDVVTPVGIKITTKRTGKSQKINSRKYKLNTCKQSFTCHSLERFYERSGRRGYSAKDFHTNMYDNWIDTLKLFQENDTDYKSLRDSISFKSNWLVPFGYGMGEGAFLGEVTPFPTVINDIYSVRYFHNKPMYFRHCGRMTASNQFTARTFVHHSHMYEEQKRVCHLIKDGNYRDAFDLNFAMLREEK